MEEKKLVPKRRFREFQENWKKQTLNEMFTQLNGGASIKPTDYEEKGIRTIPKGAVNPTGVADLSGSKYISYKFMNDNISSSVGSGGLVTTLRDLIPAGPNLGRIVKIKSGNEQYLMPQGVYKLSLHSNIHEQFTITLSNSNRFREEVLKEKSGSTQVHIRNGDFLKIEVIIPNFTEQQKIGEFFKVLDERIANQERKIAKVKALKGAYLTEMFPQTGETVPKRRFAGFEGEWGNNKLNEISIITAGGDIERDKISMTGLYPVIANTYGNKGIVGYYKSQYKVQAPAVTVTGRGNVGFAKARFENFTPVIRLLVIKSGLDVYFLEQVINRLNIIVESTGVPQLTAPQLGSFSVMYPKLEEQQKIGSFFKNLDDQIATEEAKLAKLKEMKEAYLEEMFV